jgi:hypothetical protein
MFNANNVLDLLVEALREGGEVRLREFAKIYATENLGQINEEALEQVILEILAALNNFDKAAAITVVEGAPERIRFVEEDSADEDEDEETDEDSDQPDLAGRVTALEAEVARLKEIASRYV